MKEDLIQALTSYMETMEQKMNSMDKRVAELEQNLHTINQENDNLRGKLQQMETLLVAANQQMVQLQIENKTSVLPDVKPVEKPAEKPAEPEIVLPEEPVIEEPVIDEPVIEEPVIEEAPVLPEEPVIDEPAIEEPALSIEDLPVAADLDDAIEMPIDEMPELVPVTDPMAEVVTEPLFEPVSQAAEPAPKAMAQPIAEPEITPVEAPKAEPAQPEQPTEPAQPAARPTTLFGSPVSDIRQAISLGDRFLFQRELFEQSGEKMQKTLDAINKCQSYDEAVKMLDITYHWDKETTAYTLFMAALQRRFS